MSLTSLVKEAKDLNSGLTTFSNGISSDTGDFDKNKSNDGGILGTVNAALDVVQDAANFVSNLAGSRDSMYVIGEVTSDWLDEDSTSGSILKATGVSSMVKAVSSLAGYGTTQTGVIIDGIGSVTGSFGIDLPKNPMLYRSSYITDQRVRTPDACSMKVYVNNYLTDDVIDIGLNYLSNKLGTVGKMASKAAGMFLQGGETRSQRAVYNLRWLQNNGIPFKVYTPHCIFENMLIKDIKLNTDDSSMDTAVIDLNFVELLMYTPNSNTNTLPTKKHVTASESVYDTVTGWFK